MENDIFNFATQLKEAALTMPVNIANVDPQELRRAALDGTPVDRAEFTRTISINVDGYCKAMKSIQVLFDRASRTKRPGGMWLLGDGGEGKTFVLEKFFQKHTPQETTTSRIYPVLAFSFKTRPAVSDILLTILLELGYPSNLLRNQKNLELQNMAVKAMDTCQVRMLIFDEAQHLWLRAITKNERVQDRIGGQVGEFLKTLYDQTGVAYVFSGTNGIRNVFEKDTQANTRWPALVQLKPFADDEIFRMLLASLDAAIPMDSPAGLSSDSLRSKIFISTEGNFRLLKAFLSEAVFIASSVGAKSIGEMHLQQAYFNIFGREKTPFGHYEL